MDRKIIPFRKPVQQPATEAPRLHAGDDEEGWTMVAIPQATAVQARAVY